jgi:polyisoprenoid-binding protein YceI
MKRIGTLFIMLALLMPLNAAAQMYNVDPAHTTIKFKVRNMGIMHVTGVFNAFKGTVDIDETDIAKSKVDVSIETASINTDINRRDNHLRSPDFFDVVKFPVMTFVSTGIEAGTDKDKLKVTGNLTIKGVTKQVTLIVEGPKNLQGDLKPSASATATVNRQDYGVSWGGIIGDEVFITINTELIKQ